MKEQAGKSTGAIIGAIIIIVILVIGGILLSQQEKAMDTNLVDGIEDVTPTEDVVMQESQAEAALGTSTDVADIEADLDVVTDLNELDTELQALEAELAL